MSRQLAPAQASVTRRVVSALLLSLSIGAAPAAADEIHKWVDEQGRVHFGNKKPASAVEVESATGGVVNQAESKSGEAASDAPLDSKEVADRLNKLRRQNHHPATPASATKPSEAKPTEAWCKKTFNKTCKELEEWRAKALEDCKTRNSAHCDDPDWIAREEPKTVDEIAELDEDRRERNAQDDDDDDDGDEDDEDGDEDDPDDDPDDPDDDPEDDEDEDDEDSDDDDADDADDDNADGRHDRPDKQRKTIDNARKQTAKPRPSGRAPASN